MAQVKTKLPNITAPGNAGSDMHASPPLLDKSYFNWARQSGQPWPERPRIQDYTRTKRLKDLHHVILPEINVPIQEVIHSRDGTLRFSVKVSNLISFKLNELIDKLLESKNTGGIPRYLRKAQARYRRITKHRKPSLSAVEFPFDDKRPTRIANIQFPECILELEDLTWSLADRRIRIAASAAERMLENAILWIDEQHWVLDSFKHLSCAPKERLRHDRRGSHKSVNILLEHITNGRWIWITKIKPVPRTAYMLAAKKQHRPQEWAQLRVHINIHTTKALHDARMAFFSLRPKDPKEALDRFCESRRVPINTLSGMLVTLSLSYILCEYKNAEILESVSKRLPKEMNKYWVIYSTETSDLEELLKTNSEPDHRRLARLLRRPTSLKRAQTDPEALRMASKRLLIEKEDPSGRFHNCELRPCPVVEGKRAAAERRTIVRATVRQAILDYAREKSCHEMTCFPCFWENTAASCATHKTKMLKSKKRDYPCSRCWVIRILQNRRRSRKEEKKDRESEQMREIHWDREHQSIESPEGWCCHSEQECSPKCMQEHRTCPGNGDDCEVKRSIYAPDIWIDGEGKKVDVMKPVRKVDKTYRKKPLLPEKLPVLKESLPQFSAEEDHDNSFSRSINDDNGSRNGFWKTIRRWTKSKKSGHLARLQAKVQMRPITIR